MSIAPLTLQPIPSPLLWFAKGTVALLPAPVLSNPDNDNLAWTYSSPDPGAFSLQNSDDGIAGWNDFDVADGSARVYFGVATNSYYRIFAVDNDNHQISNFSNVVFVP